MKKITKISDYLTEKEGPIRADTLEEAISKIVKRHCGMDMPAEDIVLHSRYDIIKPTKEM
jgi:hypothetical protein